MDGVETEGIYIKELDENLSERFLNIYLKVKLKNQSFYVAKIHFNKANKTLKLQSVKKADWNTDLSDAAIW